MITDTASYSDIVFGLFAICGYQFSPRIADISDSRLWLMDPDANYGLLDQLARHRVQHARILAHYVRIFKTLRILQVLHDESYRRTIGSQLNLHESRNGLARQIRHGQHGQLRERYREGMEDQLGALGLVLSATVLWNTIHMPTAPPIVRSRSRRSSPPRPPRRTSATSTASSMSPVAANSPTHSLAFSKRVARKRPPSRRRSRETSRARRLDHDGRCAPRPVG